MPFEKGRKKTGGKVAGTSRKSRAEGACKKLGIDSFEILAMLAAGKMPCNVCRGTGKTMYQAGQGDKVFARKCESCYGSGYERIGPKDRGWAAAELCHYQAPKLKAIELTGEDGGPVKASVTVQIVDT